MKRFACFILTLFFMLSGCRYVSDKNNSSSEDAPAMSDVAYSSQMMQSVPSYVGCEFVWMEQQWSYAVAASLVGQYCIKSYDLKGHGFKGYCTGIGQFSNNVSGCIIQAILQSGDSFGRAANEGYLDIAIWLAICADKQRKTAGQRIFHRYDSVDAPKYPIVRI